MNDGPDQTPLDAFHRHEVLHVASIMADFFDRHLLTARAVQEEPELRAKAEVISELLGDLYQAAGVLGVSTEAVEDSENT